MRLLLSFCFLFVMSSAFSQKHPVTFACKDSSTNVPVGIYKGMGICKGKSGAVDIKHHHEGRFTLQLEEGEWVFEMTSDHGSKKTVKFKVEGEMVIEVLFPY